MGDMSNILSGGQSGGYQDLEDAIQKAIGSSTQFYNQGNSALSPYNQAGQSAIPQYQSALNNIQGQQNGNWMKSYQESPYAKYLTTTELNAGNNAAAGGGILGTGANQKADMTLANNITGGDMQNYFNNMQSQNQQYLGGLQNEMGQGLSAGQGQAGLAGNFGNMLANLITAQGQAQGNANVASTQGKESGLGGLISGASSGAGGAGKGTGFSSLADLGAV